VDAPPEACYELWREVGNLGRFLSFVDSVERIGESWSHWVGKERGEKTVGWDSEVTEDPLKRTLSWLPLGGGSEAVEVSVQFDPATAGRGTIVRLCLKHREKVDVLRAIRELHRFKQWKETGEIATTEGQPAGRRGPIERLIRKGEQS
jgi:uncharacterized membrane protein